MKRRIWTVAFASTALMPVSVSGESAADFRDFRWGDSEEYVLQEEARRSPRDVEMPEYFWVDLDGNRFKLSFKFSSSRLTEANYQRIELLKDDALPHEVHAAFLVATACEKVGRLLLSKYGPPNEKTEYAGAPQRHFFAQERVTERPAQALLRANADEFASVAEGQLAISRTIEWTNERSVVAWTYKFGPESIALGGYTLNTSCFIFYRPNSDILRMISEDRRSKAIDQL